MQRKITYTKEKLNFGIAMLWLKNGYRANREGWNGKSQYIELASNISWKRPDQSGMSSTPSASSAKTCPSALTEKEDVALESATIAAF